MKKRIAIILSLAMMFGAASCGDFRGVGDRGFGRDPESLVGCG